jgi:hypothetical protein
MCVVVAVKIDGKYVLAKNRDRNYIPTINFKKRQKGSIEYRTLVDNDTMWAEGINSYGIAIVNSALMVMDDEKAISKSKEKGVKISHDGNVIKQALKHTKVENAVKYIVQNDVFGFTLVTDGDDLYVIENVRTWDKSEEKSIQIRHQMNWHKHNDADGNFVVRTNHGEYFNQAGYLLGTMDGKSSRMRRSQVENALKKNPPKTMKDILECMRVEGDKNPKNNPVRKRKLGCPLYTTGQYVINPSNKTFYYVPIDCKVTIDNDKYVDGIFQKEDKTRLYVVKNFDDLTEGLNFKEYYHDNWITTI